MEIKKRQLSKKRINLYSVLLIFALLISSACSDDEKTPEIDVEDDVTNESSSYITLPATIQAEDYVTESGTKTQDTEDDGGGENVCWIDQGDYLTFNVHAPSAGEYKIDFRLAAKNTSSKFDIYVGDTYLESVSQDVTGDWQLWDTTTVTVNLNSGNQTIKLVATGGGWNLNWLHIEPQKVDPEAINLYLRVHVMKDVWDHPSDIQLTSWVTPNDVTAVIMPAINQIWSANTNIVWNLESIIEEPVYKGDDYESTVDYMVNADRDDNSGTRFKTLLSLIQPDNHVDRSELGNYLYHIYLFPFVGNTLQGTAYYNSNYAVASIWSNKHNGGGDPEKTLLTEDNNAFVRGSLSRTIAHELGHNLGLTHSDCNPCLMKNGGYSITDEQAVSSEAEAKRDKF